MDCHRCKYLRYDGCRYGRCSHPGHQDVRFILKHNRGPNSKRPYSREVCKEFVLRRKCSNCINWVRGKYFADGMTPATKGRCKLMVCERNGEDCPLWELGPTSWRKK